MFALPEQQHEAAKQVAHGWGSCGSMCTLLRDMAAAGAQERTGWMHVCGSRPTIRLEHSLVHEQLDPLGCLHSMTQQARTAQPCVQAS